MAYLYAAILGAVSLPLLPHHWIPSAPALAVITLVAGLLSACAHRLRLRLSARALLLCASGWAGLTLASVGVNRLVDSQLDEQWHGRDIRIRGSVESLVDQNATMQRFHLRVHEAQQDQVASALHDRLVRLSWYYGAQPRPGEVWDLTVRLKRPRGFVNPFGFDYSAWLLSQELVATGYVRSGVLLEEQRKRPLPEQWREYLSTHLFAQDLASVPFFRALLLGDKQAIGSDQWRVLQRTGTIHLMAISGLHVGLVAALSYLLAWWLVRSVGPGLSAGRVQFLVRVVPTIAAVLAAFCYSALAGFSIPTQRAMTLVAIASLALMVGLRPRPLHLLAWAAILVLLSSPMAPTQNGFWLSFGAVVVLVAGFSGQRPLPGTVALCKAQALLAVGLIAPLLALGQAVSLIGPLANLLAVPVVSLVIVPGLILAAVVSSVFPAGAAVVLTALDVIFQWLWHGLAWMSAVEMAQWWPSFPTSAALIVLLGLGSALLLGPPGLYLRGLGAMVVAFALLAPRQSTGQLAVTAVEVGQGLAVWVQTPSSSLLYDTGPRFSADFDAGSRIVAPFLQSQGVRGLDTLIVSHGDSDHSGGTSGLLQSLSVQRFLVGDTSMQAAYPQAEACQQGDHWQVDGVDFQVLWPAESAPQDSNNRSCVLLIRWQNHTVLLAGDIDASIEQRLVETQLIPRQLSLLVAPHHGSKTSSSRVLVDYAMPDAVVFSAGYQNRYGHPHPDVVARYLDVGSSIYNTAEQGAVTFTWTGAGDAEVITARQRANRAWY